MLVRWLLLVTLLLGLVGMHHVIPTHTLHTGATPFTAEQVVNHHGEDGAEQDPAPVHNTLDALTHLCLAVLLGGVGLVLVLVGRLLRDRWAAPATSSWFGVCSFVERAPPSGRRPLGFSYRLRVLRL